MLIEESTLEIYCFSITLLSPVASPSEDLIASNMDVMSVDSCIMDKG